MTFQSYDSRIATWTPARNPLPEHPQDIANKPATLQIWSDWDYSQTTRKHFYMWLEQHTNLDLPEKRKGEAVRKWIDDGQAEGLCGGIVKIEYMEGK